MKKNSRIFRLTGIIITVIFLTFPVVSQQFSNSGQTLTGLYAGSADWGFYDSGNTPDLLLTGLNSSGVPVTIIYSNSAGTLSEVTHSITGVYFGEALWGDYDNDGDLDIVVSGLDASGNTVAEIWQNNSGTFTEDTDQDLTGLRYSASAWGDINNDGLLDLVMTGMDRFGAPQTYVYKNRKAEGVNRYVLEQETVQSFLNISKGSLALCDFDQDGDLDISLSGIDAGGFPNAAIYINDPVGFFVYDNVNSTILEKLSSGSISWGDANGDGYPDLLQTGLNSKWETVTVLFENEHNGRLGDDVLSSTGIQTIAGSGIWADFDNDGDMDIALSGKDESSNIYGNMMSHLTDFTFLETSGLFGSLREGDIAAGDYDSDGKLDIIISGVNSSGQFQTVLYRNTTVASAASPQPPAALNQVTVTNDKVLLSWDRGSDNITTDENLLTYNVRIGVQGDPDKIMSGTVPVGPGNSGNMVSLTLNTQLSEGDYIWSVQTMNSQFVRSAWSTEGTFSVEQFVSSLQNLSGFQFAASAWGDYDNDGDPDLVIAGTDANNNNRTVLYNNENGILAEDFTVNTNLVKFNYGDFAWGDVDNDGDLDLAYTGFYIRESATSGLYLNNNGVLTEQQAVFAEVGFASLDLGDYDNDGDLDLAVMGKTTAGPYIMKTYTNEAGVFTEDTNNSFTGYANGSLKFVDYDNDGDLDLAVTGQSATNDNKIRLFKNDPVGLFVEDTANDLPASQSSDFTWADMDDDGDLDMIVSGYFDSEGDVKTAVYKNDPAGTFTELTDLSVLLPGVYGGSLASGDYDNDGDPDLVISGYDLSAPVLKVYKNNQTSFIEESLDILTNRGVYFSTVSFVDIDSDDDLELVSIGQTTTDGVNYSAASFVYDNVNSRVNPNTPPTAPASLISAVSIDAVSLSWASSQDLPLGSPLRDYLTYQFRIGTTSGGSEIVSGVTPAGIGTYGSALSRTITGLVSGDYYWSVRAVDNGLAASDWSTEEVFRVDTDPPTVLTSNVTATPDTAGIGKVTILISVTENFDLDNSELPIVQAMLTGGQTALVTMISYSGSNWIGELDVSGLYSSGNVGFLISGIRDAVGNFMTPVTIIGRLYIDTDRPEIYSTFPETDHQGTPRSFTLTATFTERIDPASVDNTVLKLVEGTEEKTPASDVQLSSDGFTLSRLYSDLPGETDLAGVVTAEVQDRAGNRMETFYSWSFKTARIVSALSGGSISNNDGTVSLYFSPTALPADAEITIEAVTPLVLPTGVTFVDVAYQIGPTGGLTLNKPTKLTITYDEAAIGFAKGMNTNVSESKLTLYYQDPVNSSDWERIGGTIDPINNTISASVSNLGVFGIFEDLTGGTGTESITNITFTPRVFGPKGSGFLPTETSINFVLGQEMNVSILIFNSSGRFLRQLMENRLLNAGQQLVVWNGKDGEGRILPSGLYTVIIKAGGKSEIKTVGISNK